MNKATLDALSTLDAVFVDCRKLPGILRADYRQGQILFNAEQPPHGKWQSRESIPGFMPYFAVMVDYSTADSAKRTNEIIRELFENKLLHGVKVVFPVSPPFELKLGFYFLTREEQQNVRQQIMLPMTRSGRQAMQWAIEKRALPGPHPFPEAYRAIKYINRKNWIPQALLRLSE